MNFMDKVKHMTQKQIAQTMVDLVTHVSPDTFMKLTYLSSMLVEGQNGVAAVNAVKESLQKGDTGQAARMFRRVMTELSPQCLKAVARALFINGLLLSSAQRSQFSAKHGFDPPFTLLISPTMRCNLSCKGCYAGKYQHGDGLPYGLLDRLITEAKEMGILFITFSGGEPLIRKRDLFSLLEKHNDMYFMFYTNGTLIDDSVADELYRLGNAGAIMSLEGFEDATDARRGTGVYNRVMESMHRLKNRGVPFGTSLTVTRKNVEELTSDELYQHLEDVGVMVLWYFLFMPVGKDSDVSLMPTPQQREYLRERDAYLREEYSIFIADFWNDAPYVGGCIAGGRNYIHINANGDVEPCVFTHVAVDKIFDKSLADVLGSGFFRKIRSLQPYSENLLTPCMIIDNPHVFRKVVQEYEAYPTHDGADDVTGKFSKELDLYGSQMHELFDPIWEREKNSYGYPDAPSQSEAVIRESRACERSLESRI